MIKFVVKIAECNIAVKALHNETKGKFIDYLSNEPAQITIETDKEKIYAERQLMKQNNTDNQLDIDGFSDVSIELNYLYREVAEQLSRYQVVLIHGSAISAWGEGYIFAAPSGTGKSTHTQLWMKSFGNHAVMVNDDKPLLKCIDDKIYVYGSPWNGKHNIGTNIFVPLKAICFLERGKENIIESVNGTDAFIPLLKAVYHSKTAENEACILQSLHNVCQRVDFYRLKCNMEADAARVAFDGMNNRHSTV